MAMHLSVVNTVVNGIFIHPMYGAVQLHGGMSRRLYTHSLKPSSVLYTRSTTRNDPHSNPPFGG